ncbi:unnamed protein product [Hermetia illucens]|uniref:Nose resistant-to-fluoxetine protein N-terminal domain-containing protein n=1 Tax=Hermetia illucens TaxID=343691 RepID=A0A7R8UVA4_HERIL|nr:unnamed protein product [Hermetia illucens]
MLLVLYPKDQTQCTMTLPSVVIIVWTFTLTAWAYSVTLETTTIKSQYGNYSSKFMDSSVRKLGRQKASGTLVKSGPVLGESISGYPARIDFNVDDFEDLSDNFKKGDVNIEEVGVLKNVQLLSSTLEPNPLPRVFLGNNDSNYHIFKVSKSPKQKMKNFDATKKEELHKHIAFRFNSFETPNFNVPNVSGVNDTDFKGFEVLTNMYNHYHWQPTEIRSKVSVACGVELYAYFSALNNNAEWAQKAYDSSGRYRGQFLYGNDLWLGEKIFCDEINHHTTEMEREQFFFSFFVARILIKSNSVVREPQVLNLGECLPKSCTTKDVKSILDLDPYAYMLNGGSSSERVTILDVRRVPGNFAVWNDKGFYILSFSFLLIFITAIISTLYENKLEQKSKAEIKGPRQNVENHDPENGKVFELFQMQTPTQIGNNNNNSELESNKSKFGGNEENPLPEPNKETSNSWRKLGVATQILLCFSLRSNMKAIFVQNHRNEKLLSSMHGMRVISLLWTILVHTYIFVFNIGENRYRRTITERSFTYQLIGNATFSVDTFFFISGLLVTYLFLKEDKTIEKSTTTFAKNGALKAVILLSYRYIRLTPAYLFVIFFNKISMEYILNASVFTPSLIDYPACAKYWWRNILYINNWYPFNEFCLHWSWYLANDMQLYIMAIILLIVSKRYFKWSVSILLAILCTSWATSGVVSLHCNYIYKVAKPFESFDILYDKPWQRAGSYIVGMITGYVVHVVRIKPRIPFVVNVGLWLCTMSIFFGLVFGVWNGQLGLLSTAFYTGVGHTAWALGLVWITLSCAWGFNRPLNNFLSYSVFLPFSRLTYCTYLIHPIIISIVTFHVKGPMNLQHPILFTLFLGAHDKVVENSFPKADN